MIAAARSAETQTPEARVEALIALTERLSAIFTEENAALAARRPREIAPLQQEKARLAAVYADSIREIAIDRSLVAGAGDRLMEKLKSITRAFEERADEQRALLSGASLAAEGVIRAVAEEAGAAAASPAYRGRAPHPERTAPIAVNEEA